MRIVSAHQPAYLPWLGYFHKIMLSDVFVILDDVQFEKNSFVNRNRIKGSSGEFWLSIPTKQKGHLAKKLRDIEINGDDRWRGRHLKSIESCYGKAKYFREFIGLFRETYDRNWENLVDPTCRMLEDFLRILKIDTEVHRMSEFKFQQKKADLVLEICEQFDARVYVSGALGRDYLDVRKFNDRGISVYFQNYQHPLYDQLFGEFVPNLGIPDLLFNVGPEAAAAIGSGNISKREILENSFDVPDMGGT